MDDLCFKLIVSAFIRDWYMIKANETPDRTMRDLLNEKAKGCEKIRKHYSEAINGWGDDED